jgi:hypothetical protein
MIDVEIFKTLPKPEQVRYYYQTTPEERLLLDRYVDAFDLMLFRPSKDEITAEVKIFPK